MIGCLRMEMLTTVPSSPALATENLTGLQVKFTDVAILPGYI